MALHFENYAYRIDERDAKTAGPPYYRWKVFLNEPPEKVREVHSVEYRLHETFPDPIRVVRDASTGFALTSQGWGEFTIFITVTMKDSTVTRQSYPLDLSKPWPRTLGGPNPIGAAG